MQQNSPIQPADSVDTFYHNRTTDISIAQDLPATDDTLSSLEVSKIMPRILTLGYRLTGVKIPFPGLPGYQVGGLKRTIVTISSTVHIAAVEVRS